MSKSPDVPFFHITGYMGSLAVSARWKDGYLTADPELLDAVQLQVAAGEHFEVGPTQPPVVASLDDALSAAVTVIRCLQGITRAELHFGVDGDHRAAMALRGLGAEIPQGAPSTPGSL